jgi:GNAT superfamily N-acetyltransferase
VIGEPAVTIARVAADAAEARDLMDALDADLQRRYPGASIQGLNPGDAEGARLAFFVARTDDRPVGCAALRELDPAIGEVKRMFVRAEYRGRGIGQQLLQALEAYARVRGYDALRLETGDRQPEAIALYLSGGYVAIPPFGQYVGNPYSRCFEKRLAGASVDVTET